MSDLLLELGTEEIPARFLPAARTALLQAATVDLERWQLEHTNARILGTPRRLTLIVEGLPDKQQDYSETVTGPPWDRAFDDNGPTKAAIGFARKQGIEPDQLEQIETAKGVMAGLTAERTGAATADLLAEAIPRWIDALPFGKNMRWESTGIRFARPIRWLVVLLGDAIVEVRVAGLAAGRETRGHRFFGEVFNAGSASHYLQELERQHVMLDPEQRRASIVQQGSGLADAINHTVDWDDDLLDEVVDLVEWPTPLLASFDPSFLDLPDVVLEAPMKKHQKYFPVRDSRGRIANHFLIVSNQPGDDEGLITAGNQRVLSARLADAKFFWDQDRKKTLAEHADVISRITWQQGLGTLFDLKERTKALSTEILGWFAGNRETLATVADLYLADLGTLMVNEFAGLEGEMGAIYARHEGISDAVVGALREAHRPAGPDDDLPQSSEGTALAIAHRVDLIVGNLIAGHEVTGSQDPYGMRRAAIGLFRIFASIDTRATPADLCRDMLAQYRDAPWLDLAIPEDIEATIDTFWQVRLAAYVENQGADAALARAVVTASGGHVSGTQARLAAIENAFADADRRDRFLDTYKRLRNISRGAEPLAEEALTEWDDAETANFASQLSACELSLEDLLASAIQPFPPGEMAREPIALLAALDPLIAAATQLFDEVKINTDDESLTRQRQSLIKSAQCCFDRIADFDIYISGSKT